MAGLGDIRRKPKKDTSNKSDGSVGIIGKGLGALGLDIGGHRAATSWMDAARNTIETPMRSEDRRGAFLPIDGDGLAAPEFVVAADRGQNRVLDQGAEARVHGNIRPGDQDWDEAKEVSGGSFDAAGLAATGGFAAGLAGAVPDNAVGMFGGKLAKTADHAALARAEELAAQGAPREQIWNDTGWFQGQDGKWRFEIDDSQAKLIDPWGANYEKHVRAHMPENPTPDMPPPQAMGLDDYMAHPELERAYWPVREDAPSVMFGGLPTETTRGAYLPNLDFVAMSPSSYLFPDGGRSTALHELQHAIQHREGFAPGSSPRAAPQWMVDAERTRMLAQPEGQSWDSVSTSAPDTSDEAIRHSLYRGIAGEVEARNVQARADFTPEQRRATPPWATQDVPDSEFTRPGKYRPALSESVDPNSPTGASVPLAMQAAERPLRGYHGGPGTNPYMWDTGKGHIEQFKPGQDGAVFFSDNPSLAGDYANTKYPDRPAVYPADLDFKNPLVVDRAASFENHKTLFDRAREGGHDGVIMRNADDSVDGAPNRGASSVYAAISPNTVRSATTGETLFANNKNAAAVPLAAQIGDMGEFYGPNRGKFKITKIEPDGGAYGVRWNETKQEWTKTETYFPADNAKKNQGDGQLFANNKNAAAVPLLAQPQEPKGLRGYHGTAKTFDRFQEPDGGGNYADLDVPHEGVWFADNPARAEWFANKHARQLGENADGPQIIPTEMRFKNPYHHPAEAFADEGISSLPSEYELRSLGHDGAIIPRAQWEHVNGELQLIPQGTDYQALQPGTVFSSTTGKQLYANHPFGAAAPLAFSEDPQADGYASGGSVTLDDFMRRHEGFTPRAQWDYAQHSNGYGTRARYPGEEISREEAERRFQTEKAQARAIVEQFAPQLDEGSKAALTDLTYNAGDKWTRSGLGEAVRSGDLDRAKSLYLQYTKAGGETLPGLVRRRQEGAALFGSQMPDQGPTLAQSAPQGDFFADKPLSLTGNELPPLDRAEPPGMMALGGPGYLQEPETVDNANPQESSTGMSRDASRAPFNAQDYRTSPQVQASRAGRDASQAEWVQGPLGLMPKYSDGSMPLQGFADGGGVGGLGGIKAPMRQKLYPGEDAYFKSNTHVGGMAAEDNQVILNPYSSLSDQEKAAVARNEAARIHMRSGDNRPNYAITDAQRGAFAGTEYGQDDQALRETLAARILTGDPSAGEITPEQRAYVDGNLKGFAGGGMVGLETPLQGGNGVSGAMDGALQPGYSGHLLSDIAGRTDEIPLEVSSGSYIVPADIVSALGEGNTLAGTKVLGQMFPQEAPTLQFSAGGRVPIIVAGGEFALSPEQVAKIGGGDLNAGHAALDEWVRAVRAHTIQTLQSLPGPAQE